MVQNLLILPIESNYVAIYHVLIYIIYTSNQTVTKSYNYQILSNQK